MAKYRKRPVVVEAVVWNPTENGTQQPTWPTSHNVAKQWMVCPIDLNLLIPTLEGEMRATPGDYIIKGIHGEFYPCKPDIFEKTYEKVEE